MLKDFYSRKAWGPWSARSLYVPETSTEQFIADEIARALRLDSLEKHLVRILDRELRPPAPKKQQGQQGQQAQQGAQQQGQQGQQPPKSPAEGGGQLSPQQLAGALTNAVAHFLLEIAQRPAFLPERRGQVVNAADLAHSLFTNYFAATASKRTFVEQAMLKLVLDHPDPEKNSSLASAIKDLVAELAKTAYRGEQVYEEVEKLLEEMISLLEGTPLQFAKQQPLPPAGDPRRHWERGVTTEELLRIAKLAYAALERRNTAEFARYARIVIEGARRLQGRDEKTVRLKELAEKLNLKLLQLGIRGYDVGDILSTEPPAPAQQPAQQPTQQPPQQPAPQPAPPPAVQPTPPPAPQPAPQPPGAPAQASPAEAAGEGKISPLWVLDEKAREVARQLPSEAREVTNLLIEAANLVQEALGKWERYVVLARQALGEEVIELGGKIRESAERFFKVLQAPPAQQQGEEREEEVLEKQLGEYVRRVGRQIGERVRGGLWRVGGEERQRTLSQLRDVYKIFDALQQIEKLAPQVQSTLKGRNELILTYDTLSDLSRKGDEIMKRVRQHCDSMIAHLRWCEAVGRRLRELADAIERAAKATRPPAGAKPAEVPDLHGDAARLREIGEHCERFAQKWISVLEKQVVEVASLLTKFAKDHSRTIAIVGGTLGEVSRAMDVLANLFKEYARERGDIASGKTAATYAEELESGKEALWFHFENFQISSLLRRINGWLEIAIPLYERTFVNAPDTLNVVNRRGKERLKEIWQKIRQNLVVFKQRLSYLREFTQRLADAYSKIKLPQQGGEQLSKASFPDPWRRRRGGGKQPQWSWSLSLPRPVLAILRYWNYLTPEERNRLQRYLYNYWVAVGKDEKAEALQRLIEVAREMGITVK